MILDSGTYDLAQPLVFTADDSGTEEAPVQILRRLRQGRHQQRTRRPPAATSTQCSPRCGATSPGSSSARTPTTKSPEKAAGRTTAAVRSPLFNYNESQPLEKIDLTPGPLTNNFPADCLVEDCLITLTGRVEKQTAGVEIDIAQSITVRHCSIYDMPRAFDEVFT